MAYAWHVHVHAQIMSMRMYCMTCVMCMLLGAFACEVMNISMCMAYAWHVHGMCMVFACSGTPLQQSTYAIAVKINLSVSVRASVVFLRRYHSTVC